MTRLHRPREWPRAARFGAGVIVALTVFVAGVRWVPHFSAAFDPFLVLTVFHAVTGGTLGGLLGGVAAGWMADALTGGPYGLFGLVNGLLGHLASFTAQRLVVTRAPGIMLLFATAAAVQQALLSGILLWLVPGSEVPPYSWALVKVATTGLAGAMLFTLRHRLGSRVDTWRRSRRSRIRFGS